jgi:hypothetical protein
VFVRLQPYKQLSLKQQGKINWHPSFMDLIKLTRKSVQWLMDWSYLIKVHIHNVFHVSSLKKVLGKHQKAQTMLPTLDEEGRIILEPEAIIYVMDTLVCSS